jgi:receptor protein-tyrosine kinase
LNREYHVNEQQYHALLDKQLDAKLAQSLQSSETSIAFTVVESASQPTEPFSPRRNRLVLLGLFAGLGLGLVIAFLKEQNDTTFSNVDELQGFTTLPLLGAIPSISPASSPSELFVSPAEPDSVAAEQFRVLAMKVQHHCAGTNSRIVLITSAAGSEGKSMTAVNLTYALASMAEGPVLLVDGDMRKPRIHEYVNVKAFQGRGVFELLQSPDVDYLKYVMRIRNFNLIPGSSPTGNPVAVLSSQKARVLFGKLRRDFRYVIVDAPPTLPVADSHLLAGLSDKVLFVVRARRTPRELFQHAVESFDASNLIGAVLNDVDYQRSRYAYAYEYYKKSA